MGTGVPDSVNARQWHVVQRWQEYAGEARAALVRVVAIGLFYGVELLNYRGLSLGPISWPKLPGVDAEFHTRMTWLAGIWTLIAVAAMLCLERRIFPPWLKYLTTAADIVMLTLVLLVARGPASPLVAGYFLLIALAGLRFSLHLVWCASAGSVAGYLFLLGQAKWYAADKSHLVPRSDQAITLLALVLMGVVVGQIVRRVRSLAEHFAQRTATRSSP